MMNLIHPTPARPQPTPAALAELNFAIARTDAVLANLRADHDHQLRVRARLVTNRDRLLSRLDGRFVANLADPVYQTALEDALSGAGPLDQKLAQGMRLCNPAPACGAPSDPDPDDDDDKDPDEDDGVLRFENEGGAVPGNPGCTSGASIEPDPDFADRVVQEATDEVNAALAAAREEEAMNAIHGGAPGDESYCDANGNA